MVQRTKYERNGKQLEGGMMTAAGRCRCRIDKRVSGY